MDYKRLTQIDHEIEMAQHTIEKIKDYCNFVLKHQNRSAASERRQMKKDLSKDEMDTYFGNELYIDSSICNPAKELFIDAYEKHIEKLKQEKDNLLNRKAHWLWG